MAKIAVAPLVGAWIEIFNSGYDIVPIIVAPLVGAWIEMNHNMTAKKRAKGRSPRGSVD